MAGSTAATTNDQTAMISRAGFLAALTPRSPTRWDSPLSTDPAIGLTRPIATLKILSVIE